MRYSIILRALMIAHGGSRAAPDAAERAAAIDKAPAP
jgi:hypothetical protein